MPRGDEETPSFAGVPINGRLSGELAIRHAARLNQSSARSATAAGERAQSSAAPPGVLPAGLCGHGVIWLGVVVWIAVADGWAGCAAVDWRGVPVDVAGGQPVGVGLKEGDGLPTEVATR